MSNHEEEIIHKLTVKLHSYIDGLVPESIVKEKDNVIINILIILLSNVIYNQGSENQDHLIAFINNMIHTNIDNWMEENREKTVNEKFKN